jgi:hypothetical protein
MFPVAEKVKEGDLPLPAGRCNNDPFSTMPGQKIKRISTFKQQYEYF